MPGRDGIGAGSRIRTDDLLITNQLLYQLSYAGIYEGKAHSLTPFSRAAVPPILIPWQKLSKKADRSGFHGGITLHSSDTQASRFARAERGLRSPFARPKEQRLSRTL
jgi:hypothetical protein